MIKIMFQIRTKARNYPSSELRIKKSSKNLGNYNKQMEGDGVTLMHASRRREPRGSNTINDDRKRTRFETGGNTRDPIVIKIHFFQNGKNFIP